MNESERKFWSRVRIEDHGYKTRCFVWTGALSDDGYGLVSVEGKLMYTHVRAWTLVNGPVPPDRVIDHLCRWRPCFRTVLGGGDGNHLEPITNKENVLRGIGPTALNAQKTHCPRGHPYDDANTIIRVDPITLAERRRCRTCERQRRV